VPQRLREDYVTICLSGRKSHGARRIELRFANAFDSRPHDLTDIGATEKRERQNADHVAVFRANGVRDDVKEYENLNE
jgi:hypothetical protein